MARMGLNLSTLQSDMLAIAEAAGRLALAHFRMDENTHAEIQYKAGMSPVTAADFEVDTFLKHQLLKLLPEAGWLSEETEDGPHRLAKTRVFVVDPIDGTRAFMSGDPRWAVSVALVEHGQPVLASLFAPAMNEIFSAEIGQGAELNGKRMTHLPAEPRNIIAAGPIPLLDILSRSGMALQRVPKIPSLAYRLVSVATNAIDIGLAGPNAHDWDIAAADLILREAHVPLTGFGNERIRYNGADTRHGGLVAARDPLHKTACTMLTAALPPFAR